MSVVFSILALAAVGGLYYIVRRDLMHVRGEIAQDITTIRDQSLKDIGTLSSKVDGAVNNLSANTSSISNLMKAISINNTLYLAAALGRKELDGKPEYFTKSLRGLVASLTDVFVTVRGISVTASGIKVDCGYGQFVYNFTKSTVTYQGQKVPGIDLDAVKESVKSN